MVGVGTPTLLASCLEISCLMSVPATFGKLMFTMGGG